MGYDLHTGAILAILSAVALALLGVAVLRVPPRTRASASFSLFAILWGLQICAANMTRLATDSETAFPWVLAFTALLIPIGVPLLVFISSYPAPSNVLGRSVLAVVALSFVAALLLLLFVSAPQLFAERIDVESAGVASIRAGPLFNPLSAGVSIGLFVVALVFAAFKLFGASGEASREQLALVAAAFLLYVSNRASLLLDWGLLRRDTFTSFLAPIDYDLNIAMMVAALASVTWVFLRVLRDRTLPWRSLLLTAAVAPFVIGVLEGVLRASGAIGFDTVGLWRLAMVSLFAYAIVRYRLFDVEVRLKDAAPAVAYLVATVVGLVVLWAAFGSAFRDVPLLGVTASLGLAAACVPAVSLGRSALRRAAPHVDEPDYLYKRKLDVYRAALEEAQAKGAGEETEQLFLDDLRARLGISAQEHRILLLVLQSQEKYSGRAPALRSAKFRVEKELGRGTFGRAVLAHDTALDRPVVLKQPLAPWVLDGEGRELFLREAKLAARINHPNVVQVYEVVADEEPPMMVLEYVPGGSLEDRLRERGRLTSDEVKRLGRDVLAGLGQVHKAGIVHRDLKPANILFDEEGHAKVTDFGIAHPPPSFGKAATMATQGVQPGSLAFMSPEQSRGDDVDARTDLYSLAVVLYMALAGQHYLDLKDTSQGEARRLIQESRPRALPKGVPAALARTIRAGLAKDRDERPASAAEMARLLQGR